MKEEKEKKAAEVKVTKVHSVPQKIEPLPKEKIPLTYSID